MNTFKVESEVIDMYINNGINKISDNRKQIVKQQMLADEWLPLFDNLPKCGDYIFVKYQDGTVYPEYFDGRISVYNPITHWKKLKK